MIRGDPAAQRRPASFRVGPGDVVHPGLVIGVDQVAHRPERGHVHLAAPADPQLERLTEDLRRARGVPAVQEGPGIPVEGVDRVQVHRTLDASQGLMQPPVVLLSPVVLPGDQEPTDLPHGHERVRILRAQGAPLPLQDVLADRPRLLLATVHVPQDDEQSLPGQERLAGVRAEVLGAQPGRGAEVALGLGLVLEVPVSLAHPMMDRRGQERLGGEPPVDRRVGPRQGLADGHLRPLPLPGRRGADQVHHQEVGHGPRLARPGVGLEPRSCASRALASASSRAACASAARRLARSFASRSVRASWSARSRAPFSDPARLRK